MLELILVDVDELCKSLVDDGPWTSLGTTGTYKFGVHTEEIIKPVNCLLARSMTRDTPGGCGPA